MEQMEEEHREERKRILQSSKVHEPNSYRSASASTQISHPVMRSRVALYQSYGPPADPHRIDEDSWSSVSSSSSNSHQRHPLKQEGTGHGDSNALVEQMQLDWLDSDRQNAELAAQKQRLFDEEDRRLRAQRDELEKYAQRQFQCGVCLDEQPEDSVARLDPCGHRFCRECIRGHVGSKLAENRYPILCPVCMSEKGTSDPGCMLSYSVFATLWYSRMSFSGHQCSHSANRYLGEAVWDLGRAGNGGIFDPHPLSQVSTLGCKIQFYLTLYLQLDASVRPLWIGKISTTRLFLHAHYQSVITYGAKVVNNQLA